jgi:DNA-directed RNA polymerase subunit H (RpoH/RPB5)
MEDFELIKTNVLEMFRKRGHILSSISNICCDLDDNTHLKVRFFITFVHGNKQVETIYFMPQRIKTVSEVTRLKWKSGLLVSKGKSNASVKTFLKKESVEIFDYSFFLSPVIKHKLYQPHIKLSSKEKKTILKKYKTEDTKFPKIKANDPIVIYHDWKKGDMIKIDRLWLGTCYYRIVF